jgi:hypothetical protein
MMSDKAMNHNQALESLVGAVADEFTARVQRGERHDVEECARRHPAIAAVLREVLPLAATLDPR